MFYRYSSVSDESVAACFADVQREETLWGATDVYIREQLKTFLRATMDQEVAAFLCTKRYERYCSRRGYRNGTYSRMLETRYGTVVLDVPRVRSGRFKTALFDAYQRRQTAVNTLIQELYIAGISQRQLGELMRDLTGTRISAQAVSTTFQTLTAAATAFHRRAVPDHYRWLYLDGVALKSRGAVRGRTRIALTAYGITWDGKRELVDFMAAPSESAKHWEGFLNDLYRRGLRGSRLELVIGDGGGGLVQALKYVYPRVPFQRCWVHKMRNVCALVPRRERKAICKGLRMVYKAKTQGIAIERFWRWAKEWRQRYPKAVECVRRDIDHLFMFYRVPESYRRHVRSSNAIERCFRELRRRTRTIGCFTNDESLERVLFAVFDTINKRWGRIPLFKFTQNS